MLCSKFFCVILGGHATSSPPIPICRVQEATGLLFPGRHSQASRRGRAVCSAGVSFSSFSSFSSSPSVLFSPFSFSLLCQTIIHHRSRACLEEAAASHQGAPPHTSWHASYSRPCATDARTQRLGIITPWYTFFRNPCQANNRWHLTLYTMYENVWEFRVMV